MSAGVLIPILIVLIVVAGVTVSVMAYFQTQRHRSDAAAMAQYQQLEEEVLAQQRAVENKLTELRTRLESIEKLLKSVE